MSIGKTLRHSRKAKDLTQSELASVAGVSRMTIQRLEADGVDTKLSTLIDVARATQLELMLVPASLRHELEDFIRSGGKLIGIEPGIEAPQTAVQEMRERVMARMQKLPDFAKDPLHPTEPLSPLDDD